MEDIFCSELEEKIRVGIAGITYVNVEEPSTGKFHAIVVTDEFLGKPLLAQQRMVFAALNEEMKTKIHALTMKCYTVSKYEQFKSQQA